nr:HAMP domain-containing sensor histidine kinase [uncultured Roseateles sp.]
MTRWLRPSLSRRIILALLLAIGLLAGVVLIQDQLDLQRSMGTSVAQLGQQIAAGLDELDDPAQAAKLMSGHARHLNAQRRRQEMLPGDLLFQLFDARGQRLYASAPAEAISKPGLGEQTIGGRAYWTYRKDGERWSLRLAEPSIASTHLLGFASWELGKQLLLAFPLMLLPLWLAVRRGLAPLRRLTKGIETMDIRHQLAPLALDLRYAELRPLGQAFDTLLARLRERLAREQAFVHDAAHELRTPLAVIAAQAHTVLQTHDEATRRQASAALMQAIARSAHLSQQLLDLATLDQASPPTRDLIDVAALSADILAQHLRLASEQGIELSLEAPPQLTLHIDRGAFLSLLQNLIDNALRYVGRGGRVEVSLKLDAQGLQLAVADDGPGIAQADQVQVFERFWRGKNHDLPGTGLGLAIVRQAARRLGGQVHISAGLGQRGVCFELGIPRAALGIP